MTTSTTGMPENIIGEPSIGGAAPRRALPDTTPNTMPAPAHSPALHRNRDYVLLQSGATVSSIGNGMTSLAFLYLTVALTHSPARAGLVSGAFGLGQLVMMLPAGALVDRWNRRLTMVGTALAGSLVFASLVIADHWAHLTWAHLLVAAFLEGTLGCFYAPAEQAAVRRIVAPEQLAAAASTTMARSSLGELFGPPLAGVLYSLGRTLPFLADAASFLAAALGAALTRGDQSAPARDQGSHVLADVREGLGWVWRTRAIRDIVLTGLPINFGLTGLFTVAMLSLQQRGTSTHAMGLMQAMVSIVALVGAVLAPVVVRRIPVGVVTVWGCVAIIGVGVTTVAGTSVWWVGAVLCASMLLLMPINTGINAYQLHITPEAMQGRSGAAAGFVAMAMVPLSTGSAGFALQHLGRTTAILAYSSVFVLALVVVLGSRAVRAIPTTAGFAEAADAG